MASQTGKITKAFAKGLLNQDGRLLANPLAATHLVCLPLYNDATRVGLEQMVRTLKNDSYLSQFPQKAFRLPRVLSLPVIAFRALTIDSMMATLNVFHQLNSPAMLGKEFREDHDGGKPVDRAELGISNITDVNDRIISPEPLRPFTVTLTGLKGLEPNNDVGRGFATLHASLEYPNDRLQEFTHRVRLQFDSKGFHHLGRADYSDPFGLRLLSLRNFRGKKNSNKPIRIEDQMLLERYTNTTWLKDVRLEKLSLCKNGRKSLWSDTSPRILLDEYYEEIASIPLP